MWYLCSMFLHKICFNSAPSYIFPPCNYQRTLQEVCEAEELSGGCSRQARDNRALHASGIHWRQLRVVVFTHLFCWILLLLSGEGVNYASTYIYGFSSCFPGLTGLLASPRATLANAFCNSLQKTCCKPRGPSLHPQTSSSASEVCLKGRGKK